MNRPTTSASNIERRSLCPGSALLERGLADEDTEYSEEGNLLHALYWSGSRSTHLNDEQKGALDLAEKYTEQFFGDVRRQFHILPEEEFIDRKEVELSFRGATDGTPLFPGHADLIRTWPGRCVHAIVDLKTGFLEVEEAPSNIQLAVYAVMQHQRASRGSGIFPHNCAVALIQPRNFGPRFTSAIYGAHELQDAEALIRAIFEASLKPDAPLIAGQTQCRYCKAKTICPAYKQTFLTLVETGVRAVVTLPNDDLIRMHHAIKFAGKISKEVSEEMRRRIESNTLPGWGLKNTGSTRELVEPIGLWNAFRDKYGAKCSAARYDACRVMSWSALEEYIRIIEGCTEEKAKNILKELSEPFVKMYPKSKSPTFLK